MKKIILMLLMMFSITFCLSQNIQGIVIYKKEMLEYISDNEQFKIKNKENKEYLNKISDMDKNSKNILREIDFVLTFINQESSFKADPFLEVEGNRFLKLAIGASGRGLYYTNIIENKYYRHIDAYGETFIVNFPKNEWNLFNETKEIGNYICYKAATVKEVKGRNGIIKTPVEAWYAQDLNIPFGPLGYSGLPGLILELTVGKEKYIVNKIMLNPKIKVNVNEPLKGKKVTKKEFDEIGVNMMQSFKDSF
ncbi:MAG TPA: GLPGLI family protein [Lutibacter sp.]